MTDALVCCGFHDVDEASNETNATNTATSFGAFGVSGNIERAIERFIGQPPRFAGSVGQPRRLRNFRRFGGHQMFGQLGDLRSILLRLLGNNSAFMWEEDIPNMNAQMCIIISALHHRFLDGATDGGFECLLCLAEIFHQHDVGAIASFRLSVENPTTIGREGKTARNGWISSDHSNLLRTARGKVVEFNLWLTICGRVYEIDTLSCNCPAECLNSLGEHLLFMTATHGNSPNAPIHKGR